MSFRDFNDEGPGTFGWDYVLGGNTTGLFPEETHYEVDGDVLTEVTLVHTGGAKYDTLYGDSYTITDISPVHKGVSQDWFTFEQDGTRYKAIINKKFKPNNGCYIVDLTEV